MKIKFNPTGTSVHPTKKTLQCRLDFYFNELEAKTYSQQYVTVPVFPEIFPYNPRVDKAAYDSWVASLPLVTRLNPALCYYVNLDETGQLQTVSNFLGCLSKTFIATLDDALSKDNPHYAASLLDKLVKPAPVILKTKKYDDLIASVNQAFATYPEFDIDLGGTPMPIVPQSIDMGYDPPSAATDFYGDPYTLVGQTNAANADGTITTFYAWTTTDQNNVRFGAGYLVSGTTYKCRDSTADLGTCTGGSKQTFGSQSVSVVTGDFPMVYTTSNTQFVKYTSPGDSTMYVSGEYIDPNDQTSYTEDPTYPLYVYAIGTESGGAAFVPKIIFM